MNAASLLQHPADALRAAVALVRESLDGREHDFTTGPMPRAVGLLAIPMVLEMLMEAIFAITDIFWVARLGADAVAVVGLTEAVMTLVYAVAIGLGMGVTALVARRVGEGDDAGAARATGQSLWVGAAASVVVAIAGLGYADDILALMGAGDSVIDHAGFTRVLLGGAATAVLIFTLTAAFRGAGIPGIAMRALVIANGINILLDPCLIFGWGPFPALGVEGAAIATTLGRGVGVVYLAAMLWRGQPHLRLRLTDLVPDLPLMRHLVTISLGGIGQFLIGTSSWVLLMRIVAEHGSLAIAGYTIAIRIMDFTVLPAWGLSNSAATLVGQNLGASNLARVEDAVRVVLRYTVISLLLVGAVFLVAAVPLVGLFSDEPGIVVHGADCLRIAALSYGFFAAGLVYTQAFNGAGDTWTPTAVNFVAFWLVQIPFAWWLAHAGGLGAHGAYVAIAVAETVQALLAWAAWRRGRWQTVMV